MCLLKTQGAPLTRPEHGRLSLCPDPEAQAHGLQGRPWVGCALWGSPTRAPCPSTPAMFCDPWENAKPYGTHTPETGPHLHGRVWVCPCPWSLCSVFEWAVGPQHQACPASSAGDAGPSCLVQKNKRTVSLGAWLLGSSSAPNVGATSWSKDTSGKAGVLPALGLRSDHRCGF